MIIKIKVMTKSLLFLITVFCIQGVTTTQSSEELENKLPQELKALEFTLGKWEFNWYHLDPYSGKVVDDGLSYSNVYLIQDGTMYADDFYKKNPDGSEIRGTTFRAYDTKAKKLRMRWMVGGTLNTVDMEGNKEGENIVFYRNDEQNDQFGKYKIRITFYDIEENSYKWKRDFVFNDGTVVEKTTFYVAKRY